MFKDEIKMVENEIRMTTECDEYYDKKEIAIMIRDSTLDCELGCSLIEDEIVNDCCGCSLKFICDKIDKVAEAYIEETTKVVSTFNFEE